MSASKTTGGAAFPQPEMYSAPGMTLRDHFAGLAMQTMIHEYFTLNGPSFGDGNEAGLFHNVPSHAYKMADAMIQARDQ